MDQLSPIINRDIQDNSDNSYNSNKTPPQNHIQPIANPMLNICNLDSKEFKKLLDSQSLVDVTLACDGGKIAAHKVVLSACSSYLANILNEHPVEHPIIILPELNIDDIRTLVHYMYTGELLKSDIQHSTSLLKTAAILSVNSLNDFLSGTTTPISAPTTARPTPSTSPTTSAGTKTNDLNNQRHQNVVSNRQQQQQSQRQQHYVFNANYGSSQSLLANNRNSTSVISLSGNRNSGSSILANNTISVGNICSTNNSGIIPGNKSEFHFKCPVCETIRQTICSFEYHMQRVHNVTSFGCEICQKPFASLRYVLTDHMRRCHGWKAEQKLQC